MDSKKKKIPEAILRDRERSQKEVRQKVLEMARQGGARPGAGRPRGSQIYPNGRKNSILVNFFVDEQTKANLVRQAKEAGKSQTEYLRDLINKKET